MENNQQFYDAVVIGGGPAGLTAGLYLARAKYRVLVIEKEVFGGQITITAEVVNFPGSGPVSGTELTRRMQEQAEYFGCEFLRANVERIDASGAVRQVVTDRGTFECLGIVLATGAHPRPAGFKGEQSFRGHGVAYCATCDGAFFAGKEIFVIGGGFAAAEEAVFLTKFAFHVTILIRGEDFTCARATADQARSNPKITVLTKVEVTEVAGDSLPRSITWKNLETGEVTSWAPEMGGTFGVFVFAGYQPSTDLVAGIADRNPQGYVLTDRNQQTSWPGIYAAGDVCDKPLRQAVTAAGDGATAATELERYLAKMQKETGRRGEAPMIHRDTPQEEAAAVSEEGGLFSEEMKGQLRSIFDKMETPLVLELFLDESDLSAELRQYMDFLAGLTDKLSVTVSDASGEDLPLVRVLRADGTWTGLSFHGVPGGHEFTSFVLGLYNASGPGQQLDSDTLDRIRGLDHPVRMQILVSLSCTMCPELVTSAQRIAALSPKVQAEVYDLARYPALKERWNVMSVPCLVINGGEQVLFGKKSAAQLAAVI